MKNTSGAGGFICLVTSLLLLVDVAPAFPQTGLMLQQRQQGISAGTVTPTHHAGDLDTTFGSGGTVSANIGAQQYISAIALQGTDKIIVVGGASDGVITVDPTALFAMRFNFGGDRDTTFDEDGTLTANNFPSLFGESTFYSSAQAVVVDGINGKTILLGEAHQDDGDHHILVRYNSSDGTPDSSFGRNGVVRIDDFADVSALAIQPRDRKLIVVGTSYPVGTLYQDEVPGGVPSQFTVARYSWNGTLDRSFGTEGKVREYSFGSAFGPNPGLGRSVAKSVAIRSNGKIVVAGTYYPAPGDLLASYNSVFVLAQYDSSGHLDRTFAGGEGKTTTELMASGEVHDMALQRNGKIVVVGCTSDQPYNNFNLKAAIVRYNYNVRGTVDGTRDSTFGGSGIVLRTDSSDCADAVAIQDDGKIVVGGEMAGFGNGAALFRYNSNGTPDNTSFGDWETSPGVNRSPGVRHTTTPDDLRRFGAIVLQPGTFGDYIIAAGSTYPDSSGHSHVIVQRFFATAR